MCDPVQAVLTTGCGCAANWKFVNSVGQTQGSRSLVARCLVSVRILLVGGSVAL